MTPQPLIYVSYSELDAYRQCPLKHQWAYKDLWTGESGHDTALGRGTDWHAILQTHYGVLRDERIVDGRWVENLSKARQQAALEKAATFVWRQHLIGANGKQEEWQELLAWMYQGYLNCYGFDLSWQILLVEHAGHARLVTPSGRRSRFVLKYKADLVIRDLEFNQVKIVDHKSAKDFGREVEIDVDDQFGLYNWAMLHDPIMQARFRDWGVKPKPFAIIRSDARTQRNKSPMTLDQRFRRVQTFRPEGELRRIALDAYQAARAAYGATPLYSAPAPDRCAWRCSFLQPHLAIRKGIGSTEQVMTDFGLTRRTVKHQEYTEQEGQS